MQANVRHGPTVKKQDRQRSDPAKALAVNSTSFPIKFTGPGGDESARLTASEAQVRLNTVFVHGWERQAGGAWIATSCRVPTHPHQATATKSPVLRYRFDSAEQVARHFHVAADRVVLFFPSPQALSAGESVILEVAFKSSDQHCMLRGHVLGKDAVIQPPGWWLEFSARGLVSGLRAASVAPKRRQRRFPTQALVNVELPEGVSLVARLSDVCASGARMVSAALHCAKGDRLRIALYSGNALPTSSVAAVAAWVRGSEVGIQFQPASGLERRAIDALVDDARQGVLAAYEFAHPAICECMNGGAVIEPPLPRSAHRRTESP
jgi:hypothetical protein